MANDRSFDISARPADLGGGWRLRLLEDGENVGGGVFPPGDSHGAASEALKAAYDDALQEGHAWASPTSGRAGL